MSCLPECKRCCFCVPLRYSLLTWGYFKLIFSTVMFGLLSTIMFADNFEVLAGLNIVAIIVDIILNILFLVGGHQKNVKLLRIFLYYTFGMWILMIILALVCTGIVIFTNFFTMWLIVLLIIYIISFSISIVIQPYFMLLLRSEIIKLRSNCPYRFVKNPKDSEGTLQNEEVSDQKETEQVPI